MPLLTLTDWRECVTGLMLILQERREENHRLRAENARLRRLLGGGDRPARTPEEQAQAKERQARLTEQMREAAAWTHQARTALAMLPDFAARVREQREKLLVEADSADGWRARAEHFEAEATRLRGAEQEPPSSCCAACMQREGRLRALTEESERMRDLLREIAASGVEFEDPRIDYVTVQVDRETWTALGQWKAEPRL
jgi:hypothetical protein